MKVIGVKEVRKLKLPRPGSHKRENGRLLIIAGSERYHGSLLYAVKAGSKIVDLIYVLTTSENQKLVWKLKSRTAEFIPVKYPLLMRRGRGGRRGRGYYDTLFLSPSRGGERMFDCVLIGPGMGKSKKTYNLVKAVLKSKIRAVLDADALNVLDKKLLKLLHKGVILSPHQGEFRRVFRVAIKSTTVQNVAIRQNCTIVAKGKVDIVASPNHVVGLNYTGNAGMTKGGTGDVLAGLIAAFFCKNDAFTSAAAGVYLNGKAGDELYKKVGPFYNAEDLVEQIPRTMWGIIH